MSDQKESPKLEENKTIQSVETKASTLPGYDEVNESPSSFGNIGDPRDNAPAICEQEAEPPSVSRLSRYQMWNSSASTSSVSSQNQPAAQAQQSQFREGNSNYYLPSEFQSLTVHEAQEPNSGEQRASSLALAANRRLSASSLSSEQPSRTSDQPQVNSLLPGISDKGINHAIKVDSAPPGFHSPIAVNPSKRGKGHNNPRGGNISNRGGGGDFRLKDHRITKQDIRRIDSRNSQSDNLSGKWSSASSQNSQYSSFSSVSNQVPGDRNRRIGFSDDTSYKSHSSSHMRSDASLDSTQGSSLLRYVNSSQSVGSNRSIGGGDNMTTSSGSFSGGNYKRRDRSKGSKTQSSSAIQNMLAKSSVISPDATSGLGVVTLPSLAASSVYSDADDQHAIPKRTSGGSLSFSLPPHAFLQEKTVTGSDIDAVDRNYLDFPDGDDGEGSRASRSTVSTAHRSKGKNKDWRLKMNRLLAETPVGKLDSNEIPISVLMNVSVYFTSNYKITAIFS